MSNLLDYSGWTVGTGSVAGYTGTGSAALENERLYAPDPWGKSAIVWEANGKNEDAGYGGGFWSPWVSADYTAMYRFSVYIKRVAVNVDRDLFGLNVYDAGAGFDEAVYRSTGGSPTNNPYFDGDWRPYATYEGEWILAVGHLWPYGSGSGSVHDHSGFWQMDGTKIESNTDWIFYETTTDLVRLRIFHYDSTVTVAEFKSHYIYPRIEKVDGTELPFNWLLRGPYCQFIGYLKAGSTGDVGGGGGPQPISEGDPIEPNLDPPSPLQSQLLWKPKAWH